jgi:hypothetical protein
MVEFLGEVRTRAGETIGGIVTVRGIGPETLSILRHPVHD